MKRIAKQNAFILLFITGLYCLNRFWLKEIISLPIIGYILKCHFNDFLAGLAILAYINLLLYFSKFRKKIVFSFPIGIFISLACGLLWEYILPLIFPHGTSDPLDVFSYVFGGISYIVILHLLNHNNSLLE